MEKEDARSILESVDVEVPVATAYNQWTQFEEFPRVHGGRRVGAAARRHATCTGAPRSAAGRSSGTPRSPSSCPTSASRGAATNGAQNAGVVTFHRISDTTTPRDAPARLRARRARRERRRLLGVVRRRTQGDLERFKEFIEDRGVETGAWRGEIQQRET